MGQALTTTQFYLHGRNHFTAKGWKKAQEYYKHGFLENIDLTGRVFMVTGANSGLGKEMTKYMAFRGAKVYMVCRSKERAEAARQDLVTETGSSNLHILLGDVGLRKDVCRIVKELEEKENKLDALICNAGTITDDKTMTEEGVEVTFASHLLNGSYVLSKECVSLLSAASEPRVVFVSSGGMYNTNFPSIETATATSLTDKKYNGQLAYAYAKRGQVLLAEEWTKKPPKGGESIKFVSCHPGWVKTPGVLAVYGDKAKYLEPMRTMWQGSEGICWLAVVGASDLEGGGFYLDRKPQDRHLSSRTRNTTEEIQQMITALEKMSTQPTEK